MLQLCFHILLGKVTLKIINLTITNKMKFMFNVPVLHKVHSLFISRRALAQEGDYEMMPVRACVRACVRVCVRALVSHADSSKTTTATDFL